MSNSKNNKCIAEKVASYIERSKEANRFYGFPTSLFLTLLICLQSSDNDFGEDNASRDDLYEPGDKVPLICVLPSR